MSLPAVQVSRVKRAQRVYFLFFALSLSCRVRSHIIRQPHRRASEHISIYMLGIHDFFAPRERARARAKSLYKSEDDCWTRAAWGGFQPLDRRRRLSLSCLLSLALYYIYLYVLSSSSPAACDSQYQKAF